jgi:heme exporter protein C
MTVLIIISFICVIVSLYATFIYAPAEIIMGEIQRIFYFHMGTVWVATIAFIIVFISSILFLKNGKRKWDILALSSAEIGVVFITLTIITGSIWAKPVWGTWWTWDPQLTTTFILWILYISYLIIRSVAGDNVKQAKFAAVFSIIAFIDLPLVYISARIKRGISPVVFGSGGGGIEREMMITLLITIVACSLFFIILLKERINLERIRDDLKLIKSQRNI